ncbi:MAG TPA: hypothetical protein VL856_09365 [Acidimicrobiia bacterium]|jgi:hypothetical protein|nr:hypothetical protein [Acidimicrobiia bacterium]
MSRTATSVWTISADLVHALDAHLGAPVDSYVNGSQTWLTSDEEAMSIALEFRLHPVAGYQTPAGCSHYDVWETVVSQLASGASADALPIGDEVRGLASLWDGLECFAAYGDDIEPARLAALASELLGLPPEYAGLVDHEVVGDAWERARGNVSIIELLREQLAP